jgi:hypothetical protein
MFQKKFSGGGHSAWQVSQQQSLAVPQAASEDAWHRPRSVNQKCLGQLPAELVCPFPKQSAEGRAQGDAILADLAGFLKRKG